MPRRLAELTLEQCSVTVLPSSLSALASLSRLRVGRVMNGPPTATFANYFGDLSDSGGDNTSDDSSDSDGASDNSPPSRPVFLRRCAVS